MPPDDPLGQSTGAAVLFGATGGVMEGEYERRLVPLTVW